MDAAQLGAGALGVFAGLAVVLALVGIGLTVFWIWMIVDCATHETGEGNLKLVWILVIILTGWLGALIYLLARRQERIRQLGK